MPRPTLILKAHTVNASRPHEVRLVNETPILVDHDPELNIMHRLANIKCSCSVITAYLLGSAIPIKNNIIEAGMLFDSADRKKYRWKWDRTVACRKRYLMARAMNVSSSKVAFPFFKKSKQPCPLKPIYLRDYIVTTHFYVHKLADRIVWRCQGVKSNDGGSKGKWIDTEVFDLFFTRFKKKSHRNLQQEFYLTRKNVVIGWHDTFSTAPSTKGAIAGFTDRVVGVMPIYYEGRKYDSWPVLIDKLDHQHEIIPHKALDNTDRY